MGNAYNKCLSWFNINSKPIYQIIKKINYNDQNNQKEFYLVKHGKDPQDFFLKKVKNNTLLFNFAKNEINIMKSLKHKNIIHVHDYSINEDLTHSILVIPYYEHNDLFYYVIDQGNSIDHFYLFKQLLDILKYLKQQEVVHRDISLENIMIKRIDRDRLNIVLIDFEYAVYLDDLNTENPYKGIIGKPNYIPPELSLYNVKKQKFGFGSDMWSLANCFYTLLTKKYLFKSTKEYFYLTIDNTFIKERMLKYIIDENMINVIMDMLKYYEKDRILIENHPFL
jgi:serine/threonine protein kinase